MTLASVETNWAGLEVFRAGLEVFKAGRSIQAADDILGSGSPSGAACGTTWLQKCFLLDFPGDLLHLSTSICSSNTTTQLMKCSICKLEADNINTSCLLHTLPSQPPSPLLTAAASLFMVVEILRKSAKSET